MQRNPKNQLPEISEQSNLNSILDTVQSSEPVIFVAYNRSDYATLDGWIPTDSSEGCQKAFFPLPAGWSLAPNSPDSITVAANFPWGTDLLVFADGSQYYTNNSRYLGMAGLPRLWSCCAQGTSALNSEEAVNKNSTEMVYNVSSCEPNRRILIVRLRLIDTCGPGAYALSGPIFAGGLNHACAVMTMGRLLCWGANNYGQLGIGSSIDPPTPSEVNLSEGESVTRHSIR